MRSLLNATIMPTEENSCIPHVCEMLEELERRKKSGTRQIVKAGQRRRGVSFTSQRWRRDIPGSPLGNTFFLQYRIYADHGLHKYRCSRIGVITTLVDTANAAQYYLPPMRLWPCPTRTG